MKNIENHGRLQPATFECWGYYFMWQLRNSFGRPVMLQPEAPPYLTITPEQGVITQDSETAWDSEFLLQLDFFVAWQFSSIWMNLS